MPIVQFTVAGEAGGSPVAPVRIPVDDEEVAVESVTVSGTLTRDGTIQASFPVMQIVSDHNGKKSFADTSYAGFGVAAAVKWIIDTPDPSFFILDSGTLGDFASWKSFDDVDTPNLVTTWVPSGPETGTPVVSLSVSSKPSPVTMTVASEAGGGSHPSPIQFVVT